MLYNTRDMKVIIFYTLVICFLFACASKTKRQQDSLVSSASRGDSFYDFDLQNLGKCVSLDTGVLNSIAQKINFIRLQNTNSSNLTNLNLMLDRVGSKLIASSLRSCVLQFDSTGNYEKKLVDIGRAKNEIQNRLYQWTFQNSQVTLCQGNKMIAYNPLTGKTKGYLSKQYYYNTILLRDGNYVALPNLGPEMKDERYLDFLDAEYELVKSVSCIPSRDVYYWLPNSYTGHLDTYGLFPSYTGDVLFKDLFNDTIYKIEDMNTLVPYICLKRGDFAPTVKNVTSESDNNRLIYIKNVAESENYVFVNYGCQKSMFSVVFEKEAGTPLIQTEMEFENATSIINSRFFIDYVTPMGKRIKVGIVNVARDRLYCVVRTEDALEFMHQMGEYDNPLILEVILK